MNGFRIEAFEILNALPDGLKGAHVMARDDQLVLFKTPEKSAQEIREVLQSKLPSYMVPQQYFTIDSFPLNKNRKLDIPQLIADSELDEPLNDDPVIEDCERKDVLFLERTIALIWSKSLGVPVDIIKPSSNFFSIGGTSLSAVLVSRSLSAELSREVPVQDVFAHQTLRALAKFLSISSNIVHPGDPRPLLFLPGGTEVLDSKLYDLLQGVGLIAMSLVVFLPVIGTVLVASRSLAWFGGSLGVAFIPAILAVGCVAHLTAVLLCKKLLIGSYKEGKAKVFSAFFLKWWLMRRIMSSVRLYSWAFDDTLLSCYFFRLFGAKIGKQVSIENITLLEPDLVHIGSQSVVEYEVNFNTAEVRRGILELRSVSETSGTWTCLCMPINL